MYIGIDLGTTAIKAALYDAKGVAAEEYQEEYELKAKGEFVTQDARRWWELTKKAITYICAKNSSSVEAICICTQGISFVPIDADGEPLCEAFSWLDVRAKGEADALKNAFGEKKIYEKTGKILHECYTLPKLIWLKKNLPELYKKAFKLLMPLDYLNYRLCGRAVTDFTMASGTMLYNINSNKWDEELLEFSGINAQMLADVEEMGSVIGTLQKDVAGELGLPEGVKVVLGGQDQKVAALGAGISGDICTVSFGTSTAVSKLTRERHLDVQMRVPVFAFDKNTWIFEASTGTTGATLKWMANNLFGGKTYEELNALAEKAYGSAGGLEILHDFTKGGEIRGLSLSTTQGDIVCALYESICREIKEHIDMLGGASEICVFGGGAKSRIWRRILSDITGVKVSAAATTETGAFGAAVLASKAL